MLIIFCFLILLVLCSAVLLRQIELSNLKKHIKMILAILTTLPSFFYFLSVFIVIIIWSALSKKMQKFNKKITVLTTTIIILLCFLDTFHLVAYFYKCKIIEDYKIEIVNKNYISNQTNNFYLVYKNNQINKRFTVAYDADFYNNGNLVAKIYGIHCAKLPFILSVAQEKLSGNIGGYYTCELDLNKIIKQLLKDKK